MGYPHDCGNLQKMLVLHPNTHWYSPGFVPMSGSILHPNIVWVLSKHGDTLAISMGNMMNLRIFGYKPILMIKSYKKYCWLKHVSTDFSVLNQQNPTYFQWTNHMNSLPTGAILRALSPFLKRRRFQALWLRGATIGASEVGGTLKWSNKTWENEKTYGTTMGI